jgi:hypothetical protein
MEHILNTKRYYTDNSPTVIEDKRIQNSLKLTSLYKHQSSSYLFKKKTQTANCGVKKVVYLC